MNDPAIAALSDLVPGGARRGELRRGERVLRWVEAGAGQPTVICDAGLAEPGSLAWAGVLPALSAQAKVIAYDRAGVGASDPAHEEILATAPWQVRALMAARGAAVRLLQPLGLLERTIRSSFRPYAGRLGGDSRVQGLVLDAYAASYRSRSQVRMLGDGNRLSMTSVPAIRQIRAASALPEVPVTVLSATTGLPPATRQ